MKVRIGLVSNSSSSSFIITNKTKVELHITDFMKENEDHFREMCNTWDFFELDFDRLTSYFQNEKFFTLEAGDNKFEFSDDDSSGVDEKIDCLMHHALEKNLDGERFKSRINEWHKY